MLAASAALALRIRSERASVRKMSQTVDAAEARYRSLVERLPLIVYEDEPDQFSSAVFISPQTTEMLGYTPADWVAEREMFSKCAACPTVRILTASSSGMRRIIEGCTVRSSRNPRGSLLILPRSDKTFTGRPKIARPAVPPSTGGGRLA